MPEKRPRACTQLYKGTAYDESAVGGNSAPTDDGSRLGAPYIRAMAEDLAPLRPGLRAPPFVLPCNDHESFALTDARGGTLVVVFCPGAWEPVSDRQLVLLQEYLPEIRRLGGLLVAISVESVWSQIAFARERGLQFPLLADLYPPGRVARSYGVYSETLGASVRALFVIDGAGVIRSSRAYPLNLNPGVDDILTVLERIHESPQSG